MIDKKSKLGKGLIEVEKKLDQMPDWMKKVYNYKQTNLKNMKNRTNKSE